MIKRTTPFGLAVIAYLLLLAGCQSVTTAPKEKFQAKELACKLALSEQVWQDNLIDIRLGTLESEPLSSLVGSTAVSPIEISQIKRQYDRINETLSQQLLALVQQQALVNNSQACLLKVNMVDFAIEKRNRHIQMLIKATMFDEKKQENVWTMLSQTTSYDDVPESILVEDYVRHLLQELQQDQFLP
ncbi:hypothetical protein [Agitococcus lubricus]|uniref:LPP20 lipoprotein n=1 Tax=Agitococcus lubricus TaxID=1077255 RepID=A0A2T5J3V3_9GAMM|nr:hypothetical protein [Agitococcus lubricus]PTQ91297.1 hypothetical protein C8N29_101370 [Agitococcus lubricus]